MAHIIAVVAFLVFLASGGIAGAGALDASHSFLELKVGTVPPLRTGAQTSQVQLTGGASQIIEDPLVFEIDDYAIESAAFTGMPFLPGFRIDLGAGAATYTAGASYANPFGAGTVTGFGGTAPFTGAAVVEIAGYAVPIHADSLGVGGTELAVVLNNQIFVTGAPFNTGAVNITGITSPVLFAPSLGVTGVAFTLNLTTAQLMTAIPLTDGGNPVQVHTVTVQGSNSLTSVAQTGEIKMISPIRIRTDSESKPAALTKTFRFVPEPVAALQLLTCAAGLALLAHARLR
ncbi:MAG: hypothetical protein QF570_05880 [Myxococcota bacterium]|jgi:hypothetical protein|nr:hypothetical protein [Myxococcota bacterium]